MRFVHFSKTPLSVESLTTKNQIDCLEDAGGKPNGLWFAAGDDWKNVIASSGSGFCVARLSYAYEIRFRPEPRILTVGTLEELDGFSQEFSSISVETIGLNPRWKRFPPRLERNLIRLAHILRRRSSLHILEG